jgi:excisionase family DNA binding protein
MENAINSCKDSCDRGQGMLKQEGETVLTTFEACQYLRISRPTYLKYLTAGKIRATKAGKGWKVLRTELDRFLRGENEN